MSVWDLHELARRRRSEPDLGAELRTPPRPPGPARRRDPRPEQIAGCGVLNTSRAAGRFASTGRFTTTGDPQSFPMP